LHSADLNHCGAFLYLSDFFGSRDTAVPNDTEIRATSTNMNDERMVTHGLSQLPSGGQCGAKTLRPADPDDGDKTLRATRTTGRRTADPSDSHQDAGTRIKNLQICRLPVSQCLLSSKWICWRSCVTLRWPRGARRRRDRGGALIYCCLMLLRLALGRKRALDPLGGPRGSGIKLRKSTELQLEV